MRRLFVFVAVIFLCCTGLSFGQAPMTQGPQMRGMPMQAPPAAPSTMYDNTYNGPMNVYGQPVLTPLPGPRPGSAEQQQQFNNGLIFMAGEAVQNVGSYLWSYMPAPLRGVETQLSPPPGSGHVIVNFVPGDR